MFVDVEPAPSTSKDVDEPVDDLPDPDDPLSPEYVPKPPQTDEKVKEETTGESNGETDGAQNVDDNDIDEEDGEDEDDIEFDEDGGTNPLEPDVELGGDDDGDEEEEGSGAAKFSYGGHFLNGGGDDDEEGGQEDVDMSKVKSEAIDHDSGDEIPKAEEEAEEPKPKKPKPKHSVKGTFSCPMCPKVWGWPWELRRHVITHYKQVSRGTWPHAHFIEVEPIFYPIICLAERKGERAQL